MRMPAMYMPTNTKTSVTVTVVDTKSEEIENVFTEPISIATKSSLSLPAAELPELHSGSSHHQTSFSGSGNEPKRVNSERKPATPV